MNKKQTVSDSTKEYISQRIEIYGEEILKHHSIAIIHYSATEHYLFQALCSLIEFPGERDFALHAALNGASVRVLLKQVSSLAFYRLDASYSSDIAKACKKLDEAFRFRNSIAHCVIEPHTKDKNIKLLTLKQKPDGMPEPPKIVSVIQLKEVIERLQKQCRIIETTLVKAGVRPIKASESNATSSSGE